MLKGHLIFDFDGTLVDSFNLLLEKFNLLADEYHFRKIKESEIAGLRNLTSKEVIKFLEIPFYKIPFVLSHLRKEVNKDIVSLKPFLQLPAVLEQLNHLGFSLGILTSNSSENVNSWLSHHQISHLFKFVHIESNFFGKDKILKKIIKKYEIDTANTFYIGDETRDIEAAKYCGTKAVAVTWGFNSEKILAKYQPDFLFRKPEDMLDLAE